MKALELAEQRLAQAQLPDALMRKWQALVDELRAYPSVIVAYSGGVDSGFLAYSAALVLGERLAAVTLASKMETPEALQAAAEFAAQHGLKHISLPYDPLQMADIRANSPERCYFCKSSILQQLWDYARAHDYQVVLDGQNDDDRHDYRPGSRAVAETGTRSPLAQNGLSKADIRQLACALGLSIWDKPSAPCLATRIPYGVPITTQALSQIAQAEHFLQQQGFTQVRVRHHGDLARLEIDPDQMARLLEQRAQVVGYLKQIGFVYIALDLQGYRLGSLNEGLAL